GGHGSRFGGAVAFEDVFVEACLEVIPYFVLQLLGAGYYQAQAGELFGTDFWIPGIEAKEAGGAEQDGDVVLGNGLSAGHYISGVRVTEYRHAFKQGQQVTGGETEGVKRRQVGEYLVLVGEAQQQGRLTDIGVQAAMAEHHP